MFDSDLSIQAASPTTWRVIAPLIWTGREDDTFTVPVGFLTDFATVPRFLHWLVLPYGAYTRAAVLHDWLLTELDARDGSGTWDTAPANSRDTDGIFRAAMRDLGVGWAKRWTMWAAVRWAALFNPRRAYGRAFLKDSPKVLGISLAILATGVIPLAALAVLIALMFVRLVTWTTPPVRRIPRRGVPGRTARKDSDHDSVDPR
jgi:hypothetical protein